jgi:hypothetical protein
MGHAWEVLEIVYFESEESNGRGRSLSKTQWILVWFGLFVQPFSHTCNIGHIDYRLQLIYYSTSYMDIHTI